MKSIKILDEPLRSFELQKISMPYLIPYETIYKRSKSPREFIKSLRITYKDQYCFIVGAWIDRYFMTLRVDTFKRHWLINIDLLSTSSDFKMSEITTSWYSDFVDVDQIELFELILAANYLDLNSLLKLSSAKVATLIKDMSIPEIRTYFNIENDFTAEEEA